LEDNWLAGDAFEGQHLDPPPFLKPERHHTTADLFPIKSILFPDEGHGFQKTRNRIRSTEAVVGWFTRYLMHE
jgi:hypothetical protein